MKKLIVLLAFIAIPLVLGAFAGIVTSQNVAVWYNTLNAPSFRPPNWLFGPVWTLLYILMGVSFFMILQSNYRASKRKAIAISIIQLALNTLWSFLFFYFHQIGIALIEILLICICILLMIKSYYPINKIASYLQIPYLAWVSFASILNGAYFILN